MGIGRKLFIDNNGFDYYASKVYENVNSDKDNDRNYADLLECRQYIMQQLKLAARLNNVQSISVLKSGLIRIRTRDLFISTSETGILRKFFVGKWKIECNYHFNLKFRSCDIQELGFNSGCWGRNTVHPHISGLSAEACLGNAAAPLNMYIRNGDIKAFAMYAIGYLTSVNVRDSAGKYLARCKEVKLDDDGNVMHDENGNYMYIENEFNAEGVDYVSNSYSTNVDLKHHEFITNRSCYCEICGKPYNITHIYRIPDGDIRCICDTCIDNIKTCDCCHSIIKADDKIKSIEVNGVTICSNCVHKYLYTCGLCDTVILPDVDITKDNVKEILVSNKSNIDFNKTHTVYYSKPSQHYGNKLECTHICNSCKELAHTNEMVKNNIVMFTKAKLNNSYVNVLRDNIPYNTYKMLCTNCGNHPYVFEADNYVENMIIMNKNIRLDNGCYVRELHNENKIASDTHKATLGMYTNLLPIHEDGKLKIKIYDNDKYGMRSSGICLPRILFTDTTKWAIDKDRVRIIEYNEDTNEFNEVIEDTNNTCSNCGKHLSQDEVHYFDKNSNVFCEDCAENTYTHCTSCNKLVKLTDQHMGICTDCSNTDTTLIIDDLNISAE